MFVVIYLVSLLVCLFVCFIILKISDLNFFEIIFHLNTIENLVLSSVVISFFVSIKYL